MLVVAFESNGFVVVLFRPLMHGVHELRGDPLPPKIRNHPVKPGEKYGRLQLKAQEKAHRTIVEPSDQLQYVVAAPISPNERLHIAWRAKNLIVQLRDDRQFLRTYHVDDRIGHESIPSQHLRFELHRSGRYSEAISSAQLGTFQSDSVSTSSVSVSSSCLRSSAEDVSSINAGSISSGNSGSDESSGPFMSGKFSACSASGADVSSRRRWPESRLRFDDIVRSPLSGLLSRRPRRSGRDSSTGGSGGP